MVGSSLASWVSLDFDLDSVSCRELTGKQYLDEKTVEGCGGATIQGKVTVGQVCRIEKVVNKNMDYISRWASVHPWHNANLKLKDLVRTTSFLVGEPWALLSWASGMEQR